MAKRAGQRRRASKRRAAQRLKHPTQLGTQAPPDLEYIVTRSEWPVVLLTLLIAANAVVWQDKIVSLFG